MFFQNEKRPKNYCTVHHYTNNINAMLNTNKQNYSHAGINKPTRLIACDK
jgi:hypothetical protein